MLNPGPWCTGLYGGFAGTPAEFSAGNKSGDPALTSIVINVLKIGATTSWLFFWLWTEWNCPPQYLQHNLKIYFRCFCRKAKQFAKKANSTYLLTQLHVFYTM